MKTLNLSIKKGKEALYLRAAQAIRSAIKEGVLKPGELLPSARGLAQELSCHRHTVLSAFNELVAEGWIEGEERKSFRVSEDLPDDYFISQKSERDNEKKQSDYRLVREARITKKDVGQKIKYAFQSGLPDLRLFPNEQLRSCINDSIKRLGSNLLGYSSPFGHQPLIMEIEKYLRRVRSIKDRKIIVTNGSQEGIFIIGQLFLKPGDTVLVESFGYPPAWEALRASGAKLLGVPVDDSGIVIEELKKILRRKKPRLIYTTPLHQYPTTVTLPVPRRLELYELAAEYGIPILEDDYDHEFHYRSQPLPPLASNDPSGLVLYVSTFSKVLYPAARCGFMAVPENLFKPLSDFKRIVSRQNDTIIQDAIARWMRDGGFERHMRKMRRNYQQRRDATVEFLQNYDVNFNLPDGGMALWLDTKVNASKLSQMADKNGVHVNPEKYFTLDDRAGRHLRLGYANQTPQEIRNGLKILMRLRDSF